VLAGQYRPVMRESLTTALVVALAASLVSKPAFGADPPGAVDELKEGYALKQAGKCGEAIPHFLASYQAEPTSKALLNLADCEQQTDRLLSAKGHAEEGRDLARQQNDKVLVDVAETQLATIDQKMPRLTIHLTPRAPVGSGVLCDGSAVGAASMGVAVPLDPGPHRVIAIAPGRAQRVFNVTLIEASRTEIAVEPGGPLVADAPSATAEPGPEGSGSPTRQILSYGVLGLGAAGIVVGVATGIAAGSKHAALEGECTENNCPTSAQSDLDGFRALRTWSTVGYVVGIAGLAGGTVLWLTAPKTGERSAAALWIGPAFAGAAGRF
jgi:hypothetical protein